MTELLIHEIKYLDPIHIYNQFSADVWSMFLDSADAEQNPNPMNQCSYIAIDPFAKITYKNGRVVHNENSYLCDNPFDYVKEQLALYKIKTDINLPPLQGGAVGYFSYDLGHCLENFSSCQKDDMEFYDLAIGLYDLILSFDHAQKRAWIVSSGLPLLDEIERKKRAQERLNFALEKIDSMRDLEPISSVTLSSEQIITNFSLAAYKDAVKKIIDYIRAGDIFEANMTQRFSAPLADGMSVFDLYRRLRRINAAPFSSYLNLWKIIIASASPERFLQLHDGIVETRPIKGTRRRSTSLEEDQQLARELLASAKDRAENIMIVDLMRNDLSRVCKDNSIYVPQLCGLETFATVHHLVSVVQGELNDHVSAMDLLKVAFPGGSITGAPKIRAMEIIDELEPTRRGPYCGSIGYIGFDGCLDTSIVIRTYIIKDNQVTFQTGSAVTLDSDPQAEWEEMLNKAYALRRSLLDETIT